MSRVRRVGCSVSPRGIYLSLVVILRYVYIPRIPRSWKWNVKLQTSPVPSALRAPCLALLDSRTYEVELISLPPRVSRPPVSFLYKIVVSVTIFVRYLLYLLP